MDAMSDALSEALGERVTPQLLNSRLVSAQNRQRLYWYNWETIEEPEDRGLVLKDILEPNLESYGDMEEIFDKEFKLSKDGLCHIGNAKLSGNQTIKRVYHAEGKAPTLTTMGGGHREPKIYTGDMKFRKLTPLECERLQTFPDGYTEGVSNTQRYKMLGNSFTVKMVKCILRPMRARARYIEARKEE